MARALSRRVGNWVLPLCLAAMDGCWVFLAAWLFSTYLLARMGSPGVPSPFMLALVELAAWWLAGRLLAARALPDRAAQALSGVTGLLAALVVALSVDPPGSGGLTLGWLGGASFTIMITLALWFLGSYRASQGVGFNDAYANFRIGLVVIGACALITAWAAGAESERIWAGLGSVALWFFGWSLAALAMGNRELVRQESGETGIGAWGLVVIASIVGVLVIGSAAGLLGGPSALTILQGIVGWVVLIAGTVIYMVFYGVAWLLVAILGPERSPLQKPPPLQVEDAYSIKGRLGDEGPTTWALPFGQTVENAEVIAWIAGALVLLIVVWLVGLALRRTRSARASDTDEERGRLGSWDLLGRQVRGWISGLLARFRPAQAQTEAAAEVDELAWLRNKPEWSGTLTVRQIYARLLRLAAERGHPRARQQTPIEYLDVLSRAIPDLRPELAAITGAYIEARYGAAPASGPAVLAANEAWKRAERVLEVRGDNG